MLIRTASVRARPPASSGVQQISADTLAADQVAMALSQFFTPTPQAFLEFARTAAPAPVKRMSPWAKLWSLIQLTPPPRDPYPGETISPNANAVAYADANRGA